MSSKKIAIFASGSGTNAQNIIEYFADKTQEFKVKYQSTKDELLKTEYYETAKLYGRALSLAERECKPWKDMVVQYLNDKVNHFVNY